MCGGIFCNWDKISKDELKQFLSPEEFEKASKKDGFESYFWQKEPLLPVEDNGEIHLRRWGNRSSEINLPKTGWAKQESIDAGKWAHLNPKFIKIPAKRGIEKGVWFDIKSGGLQGVLVHKDQEERVYMITKPAEDDYQNLTSHNRQPIEYEETK
jgi:hypothetical protein